MEFEHRMSERDGTTELWAMFHGKSICITPEERNLAELGEIFSVAFPYHNNIKGVGYLQEVDAVKQRYLSYVTSNHVSFRVERSKDGPAYVMIKSYAAEHMGLYRGFRKVELSFGERQLEFLIQTYFKQEEISDAIVILQQLYYEACKKKSRWL